jgi:hypothetical protein
MLTAAASEAPRLAILPDRKGTTPLAVAALGGKFDVVRHLLEREKATVKLLERGFKCRDQG